MEGQTKNNVRKKKKQNKRNETVDNKATWQKTTHPQICRMGGEGGRDSWWNKKLNPLKTVGVWAGIALWDIDSGAKDLLLFRQFFIHYLCKTVYEPSAVCDYFIQIHGGGVCCLKMKSKFA